MFGFISKFLHHLQRHLKQFVKKNNCCISFFSWLIYSYLKLVYLTSKWNIKYEAGYSEIQFLNQKKAIFLLWHNRLAFGPKIFADRINTTLALVSPHSDGKIIGNIIKFFGFGIIEGSSNKQAFAALKNMIQKLSIGYNMVITPDGPRGPKYEINSNIIEIARRYDYKIIPITCNINNRHKKLRSWDGLIIPQNFAVIDVIIGKPINFYDNKDTNIIQIKDALMRNIKD